MVTALDWDRGRYEALAGRFADVAADAVRAVAPGPGTRLLDIGCGTGVAGLTAARLGAQVTGLDPAARLVSIASRIGRRHGLPGRWLRGRAEDLPFADAAFDAVVSSLGVALLREPARAVTELVRVLAPGGRAALTGWLPEGPLHKLGQVLRGAGPQPGSPPVRWSETATRRALLGHPSLAARRTFVLTAPDVDTFVHQTVTHHPMWVDALAGRSDRDRAAVVRAAAAVLRAHREPGRRRLRLTVPYLLIVIGPDQSDSIEETLW